MLRLGVCTGQPESGAAEPQSCRRATRGGSETDRAGPCSAWWSVGLILGGLRSHRRVIEGSAGMQQNMLTLTKTSEFHVDQIYI